MKRMILRHLSGSKANQVEEFPLDLFKELSFGRDPSSTVKYDADRDDLVGRQHAKLVQDTTDPAQFVIVDLNSRNGTYVNKQRIAGTARIMPGDVIQFGPGGPEFQFDLDPRPENLVRTTRIATTPSAAVLPSTAPPTRVVDSASSPVPPAGGTHASVGKATVERMISQTKRESRTHLTIGGAAVLVVIALVVGFLIYHNRDTSKLLQGELSKTEKRLSEVTSIMTPADIAKAYTNAVVYIEVGWKLIYTPSGGQVYHQYIANKYKDKEGVEKPIVPDGRPAVAAYVVISDSKVEPLLTLDSRLGHPIGGEHTGSGFTVTSDGFILTNRHVAATWRTAYHFREDATPGVVFQGGNVVFKNGRPVLIGAPRDWVPSETKQAGQQLQGGFEGRNDYLNVTFAKNQLRIPAKLARVSDRHDVAMVKIDIPESVAKVELNDNYDTIKPGDTAIVLGYPAVSPPVYGVVRSQDVFNRESQIKIVPDPTVSVGNVGRLLRGQEALSGNKDNVYSFFGDAYQLTINSTGGGNSGGPVFDDHGRVTGIFFAGVRTDAQISFAVPIRFGRELMTTTPAK